MKKIPATWRWFVMPLLLTFFMTAIVSAISTIHAAGNNWTVNLWLGSWLFSWIIAFPTILVVLPLLNKFLQHVIEE